MIEYRKADFAETALLAKNVDPATPQKANFRRDTPNLWKAQNFERNIYSRQTVIRRAKATPQ